MLSMVIIILISCKVWIQDLGRVIFFRKHFAKSSITYILAEIGIDLKRRVHFSELGSNVRLLQKNGSFEGSNWIQEYEITLNNEKIATAKAKLVAFDFKKQSKMIIPKDTVEYFTTLPEIHQSKL